MSTPTIIGGTQASFGLTTETGILAQRADTGTMSDKASIRDNVGFEIVVAFFNFRQQFSVSGKTYGTMGSTGLLAAAPGAASTIANAVSNSSVTSGNAIYVDQVTIGKSATDFQEFSLSATRYAAIS
jgi:Cu2+-containing amine oxidase